MCAINTLEPLENVFSKSRLSRTRSLLVLLFFASYITRRIDCSSASRISLSNLTFRVELQRSISESLGYVTPNSVAVKFESRQNKQKTCLRRCRICRWLLIDTSDVPSEETSRIKISIGTFPVMQRPSLGHTKPYVCSPANHWTYAHPNCDRFGSGEGLRMTFH